MTQKGAVAERELISMFWGSGWGAVRIAGSGASRFPCPDVLASDGSQLLAIECKACAVAKRYLEEKQVRELKEFAEKFNAKPVIAVKLKNKGWFFLGAADLKQTRNSYAVDQELLDQKAKKFFDIVRNEVQARLEI